MVDYKVLETYKFNGYQYNQYRETSLYAEYVTTKKLFGVIPYNKYIYVGTYVTTAGWVKTVELFNSTVGRGKNKWFTAYNVTTPLQLYPNPTVKKTLIPSIKQEVPPNLSLVELYDTEEDELFLTEVSQYYLDSRSDILQGELLW